MVWTEEIAEPYYIGYINDIKKMRHEKYLQENPKVKYTPQSIISRTEYSYCNVGTNQWKAPKKTFEQLHKLGIDCFVK